MQGAFRVQAGLASRFLTLCRIKLALAVFVILVYFTATAHAQLTLRIGDPAPPVTPTDWLRNAPAGTDLNGKYLVLEFWATWCAPCLRLVPHMNSLAQRFDRPELRFLNLTDEPPAVAGPVADRAGFRSLVATDIHGTTQIAFGDGSRGLSSLPFAVLIDRENVVRWFGNPERLTA